MPRIGVYDFLDNSGALAAVEEKPLEILRLWGAADFLRGTSLPPMEAAVFEPVVAAVRTRLGSDSYGAAYEEGRTMTEEQAIALALEVVHGDGNPREAGEA